MTPSRPPVRGRSGHTLIELAIVLVMIGIAISFATPRMSRYLSALRVSRALDRVASDVAFARISAMRTGAAVRVTFTGAAGYTITVPSTSRTLRSVSLATEMPGTSLTPPTSDSRLDFDSRGILRSVGTGRLVAASGGARDSVTLTLAGRMYHAQ